MADTFQSPATPRRQLGARPTEGCSASLVRAGHGAQEQLLRLEQHLAFDAVVGRVAVQQRAVRLDPHGDVLRLEDRLPRMATAGQCDAHWVQCTKNTVLSVNALCTQRNTCHAMSLDISPPSPTAITLSFS